MLEPNLYNQPRNPNSTHPHQFDDATNQPTQQPTPAPDNSIIIPPPNFDNYDNSSIMNLNSIHAQPRNSQANDDDISAMSHQTKSC